MKSKKDKWKEVLAARKRLKKANLRIFGKSSMPGDQNLPFVSDEDQKLLKQLHTDLFEKIGIFSSD